MLVVLHSLPSTNPTCHGQKCVLPLVILPFHQWLDGVSKSLVSYDFCFQDLNLPNSLRVLRQLHYRQASTLRYQTLRSCNMTLHSRRAGTYISAAGLTK
jgi:hypothetical protein